MSDSLEIDEAFVEKARELVAFAEAGDQMGVNRIMDDLTKMRENELFQELGKLTRDLHETFKSFRSDSRLNEIAGGEIQDARERLHYVITMTQQAADTTMGIVEESIPLCETIENKAADLCGSWDKFTRKEMKPAEFRQLTKDLKVFLKETNGEVDKLKHNLNEVLMAQGYQDLTGQVIYKVINLVEDVEGNLVNLIKLATEHLGIEQTEPKEKKSEELAGPVVDGVTDMSETVSGQDEVDDLLSSLGF